MATTQIQEAWFAKAVGRAINPDNAFGLQCVDVADDYALAIFPGKNWPDTIGGVSGAKDFTGRSNGYFSWHRNIPGDLYSIPQRGDVIIWGGSALNEWGHVAVVLSATSYTVTVIQQDGFLQTAAHVVTLPYDGPGTGPCTGWMRPKVQPDPVKPKLEKHQRIVGPSGVKERPKASTAGTHKNIFKVGDVLNFKGYVKGEPVGGNDVWFVGAFSGTYFHSSAFTSQSVAGLPDITPKVVTVIPKLTASQRFAGPDGAILRAAPNKNGKQTGTFKPGDVLNFKGYVHAERPYGEGSSDIWFVGISGSYIWSGGLTNGNIVTGLPDLTPKATPAPGPVIVAPLPTVGAYTFARRWDCVTRVRPAHIGNLQRGNFPARPSHLIVHQMDDPSRNPTLLGTGSWFEQDRPSAPSSTHFGAEEDELHAFVDTVDRAFGAGTVGNNYVQVEVPPNPSEKTIETVKRFQREWLAKEGYALILTDHRSVPGNSTQCGSYIPLARFSIADEIPKAPAPAPKPDAPKHADESAKGFVDYLLGLFRSSQK